MENLIKINNLKANVGNKEILKGIDLNINKGEIHVIMGPNGTGKSTLSSVIMGDPRFSVTAGEILLEDENVLDMSVDERSRAGIFLAMQYPSELTGVTNLEFLKNAVNARRDEKTQVKLLEFYNMVTSASSSLQMKEDYNERFVNVGFSGGEKKRNEIFQMLLLQPKLIILDEIDSGLDIDAIRIVGENVTKYYEENKDKVGILIITHYPRLLEYIKPDYVHIIKNGVIVKTGDINLANHLEVTGYEEV